MKSKFLLSLTCFLLVVLPLNAGWFSDDVIKIKSYTKRNLISQDVIGFTIEEPLLVANVELTLELKYSTGTKKLHVSRKFWGYKQKDKLEFSLPDGLSGLQSYRLTGKFLYLVKLNEKNEPGDPIADGYKIEGEWYVK